MFYCMFYCSCANSIRMRLKYLVDTFKVLWEILSNPEIPLTSAAKELENYKIGYRLSKV